jgi:hypothetical protein
VRREGGFYFYVFNFLYKVLLVLLLLLLSFVVKLVTQGREGVLRTTTKHMHTIYEEA